MYQPPSTPPAAAAAVAVAAAPLALHRPLSQRDHSVLAADVAAAALFTPPQLSLRQRFSRSAPTPSLLPPRRQRCRIRADNAAASKSSTVRSRAGQEDHQVLAADVDAAAPSTPPQPPLHRCCGRNAPAPMLLRCRRRCRISSANAAASKSSTVRSRMGQDHHRVLTADVDAAAPSTPLQPPLRRCCSRSAPVPTLLRRR
jgi:hypothetical protein